MRCKDRSEAGRLLAEQLQKYAHESVIVYGLPRGGVVTALEIARVLHAPLQILLAHKIGHPGDPEYAMAAISEHGDLIIDHETSDTVWLQQEAARQHQEIVRRRSSYPSSEISPKDKIAILVDDGIATGLTMRAGLKQILLEQPARTIIAAPVIPISTAQLFQQEGADEVVALQFPSEFEFLGAVSAYYDHFLPVSDEEVIHILQTYPIKQPK